MSPKRQTGETAPGPESPEERLERIAAYAEGEMSRVEAKAFERRLESDAALRRDLEEWREALEASRDWVRAEAPGIERAKAIQPPALRPHGASTPPRRLAWQALAAAALLTLGFGLGRLSLGLATTEGALETVSTPPPPTQHVIPTTHGPDIAEIPTPTHRATDEKGRLIVETTSRSSGARIIWVVDGGFRLSPSTSNQGETL